MSITRVPCSVLCSRSLANSTSVTTGPFSSITTTASTPAAASPGLPQTLAPDAAKGSAFARVRFQTRSANPASNSFSAIGRPIRPVPSKATLAIFPISSPRLR